MDDSEQHVVYPGGPQCNPYCPGEYSSYHEGYSDGYWRATDDEAALTPGGKSHEHDIDLCGECRNIERKAWREGFDDAQEGEDW